METILRILEKAKSVHWWSMSRHSEVWPTLTTKKWLKSTSSTKIKVSRSLPSPATNLVGRNLTLKLKLKSKSKALTEHNFPSSKRLTLMVKRLTQYIDISVVRVHWGNLQPRPIESSGTLLNSSWTLKARLFPTMVLERALVHFNPRLKLSLRSDSKRLTWSIKQWKFYPEDLDLRPCLPDANHNDEVSLNTTRGSLWIQYRIRDRNIHENLVFNCSIFSLN